MCTCLASQDKNKLCHFVQTSIDKSRLDVGYGNEGVPQSDNKSEPLFCPIIKAKWDNRRFPSCLSPLSQSESKCEAFHMAIWFIYMWILTNFHMKGFALGLAWNRDERQLGNRLLYAVKTVHYSNFARVVKLRRYVIASLDLSSFSCTKSDFETAQTTGASYCNYFGFKIIDTTYRSS